MTIDELKDILRYQLVTDDTHTPGDTVECWLYEGRTKITLTHKIAELDTLIPKLALYVFEGYRGRVPYFVMPDVEL